MIPSEASLGIALGKIKPFSNPKIKDEQYSTPNEIAAHAIRIAAERGDISDKKVSDLGAGTGILGIAAAYCGAKEVVFVERDEEAINQLNANLKQLSAELQSKCTIKVGQIPEIQVKSETIVMNPPFGTKIAHADKPFFESAMSSGAHAIYAFAKSATEKFVKSIAKDHNYTITHQWKYNWPLKNTSKHHTKRRKLIEVSLFRLEMD